MSLTTPVKIPKLIKGMFPKYIWNMPLNIDKTIYLTFDDGPTPEITDWTLKTLKQYNAKATFFCIGNNVEKYPEIFNSILKDGHAVGNHTHNHIKGWKTKTKDYLKNIEKAQKVFALHVESNEHQVSRLFRPPYGQITPKQGKNILKKGYQVVMWEIISIDWDKNIAPETCFKNVINTAKNGSVIVFHDSVKASKNMMYALPKVLEYYSKKGYAFKAITSTPE